MKKYIRLIIAIVMSLVVVFLNFGQAVVASLNGESIDMSEINFFYLLGNFKLQGQTFTVGSANAAFILLIASLCLLMLSMVMVAGKKVIAAKIMKFAAGIALVVTGVLYFCIASDYSNVIKQYVDPIQQEFFYKVKIGLSGYSIANAVIMMVAGCITLSGVRTHSKEAMDAKLAMEENLGNLH